MSYETMSPADYAAVNGNNNNGWGFGGDGAWWIIILLLFGWGGRGFGGGFGGGCGTPATQADLAAGFNNSAVLSNLNDLALGQANLQHSLCQGFGDLGYRISDCCCSTKQAIADVKYTIGNEACETRHAIYNSSRDIIDNANANSRAILDFLTQDKIATLTAENQSLKFAASQSAQNAFITANQEAQTAELIRRLRQPDPVPSYIVPNPNCCYQPTGYNACGGF